MRRLATLIAMAVIAAALYPSSNRAAAEADMSGDWSIVMTTVAPGEPPIGCASFVEQTGSALRAALACHVSIDGTAFNSRFVAHGYFYEKDGSFVLAAGVPGSAFGIEGVLAKGDAVMDGVWALYDDSSLIASGTFTGERTEIEWGDASCDGSANSVDALLILQDVAGLSEVACGPLADALYDGLVNVNDAAAVLQHDAGLLARLPVLPDA